MVSADIESAAQTPVQNFPAKPTKNYFALVSCSTVCMDKFGD